MQRAVGDGAHKLKSFASAIGDNHGSVGLTDLIGIIRTMEGAPKGTDKMETWKAEQVIGWLATVDAGRFSMLQVSAVS